MLMRYRGIVVVFIIFFIVFSSVMVQAIPPHKNFQETDEDLYAILSFLADAKLLCEQALMASYFANCTIFCNETILISYSQDYDNTSLETAEYLQEKLSYSSIILDQIKNKAGSYEHFKDFLLPVKKLGSNVTSVVMSQHDIILYFHTLVDSINTGSSNETLIFTLVSATQNAISRCRSDVLAVETHLGDISPFFSIEAFEQVIPSFYLLMDRYESYLNSLVGFFPAMEPVLFLSVDDTEVYLGEDFYASGYFIGKTGFVANQTITLLFDTVVTNTTKTNSIGRFDFPIHVSLDYRPASYNLTAITIYNDTLFTSNIIVVSIHKIPTTLLLSVPKNQYKPSELISFSGQLITYSNEGIQDSVILHFAGENVSLLTNDTGHFTYEFSKPLFFDEYTAYATFTPETVYEPCKSQVIKIYVNTPTYLTISTNTTDVDIGEPVIVWGALHDSLSNSPLSNKTILVFFNGQNIGTTITNQTGCYTYNFLTADFQQGTYSLYTHFPSDEQQWRSSTSETIHVVLIPGVFEQISNYLTAGQYLGLIIVLAIIILICILVFYFIKKSSVLEKKKRKYTHQTPSFFHPFSSSSHAKKHSFTKPPRLRGVSLDPAETFKQRIVKQYRLLIRFLSSKGFNIHPSHTHLDIQKNLIGTGSSKKAVDMITSQFEHARYSLHPAQKEDIIVVDKNLFTIIADFEET